MPAGSALLGIETVVVEGWPAGTASLAVATMLDEIVVVVEPPVVVEKLAGIETVVEEVPPAGAVMRVGIETVVVKELPAVTVKPADLP